MGTGLVSPGNGHSSHSVSSVSLCYWCMRTRNAIKGMKGAKIHIATDSKAAVGALFSFICESKLVWDRRFFLQQLSDHNAVIVMLMRGYSGVVGIKEADRLARKG